MHVPQKLCSVECWLVKFFTQKIAVVGNFFSVKLNELGILSFGYYVRAKFSICFWKGSICKVVKLEIGFKKKKEKRIQNTLVEWYWTKCYFLWLWWVKIPTEKSKLITFPFTTGLSKKIHRNSKRIQVQVSIYCPTSGYRMNWLPDFSCSKIRSWFDYWIKQWPNCWHISS